jgi:hypothetical protein
MLSKNELDIISNSLANIYDWDSEKVEKDFVTFLKDEIPSLQEKKIESLFTAYDKLPVKEKMSLHFDYQDFITSHLDL